jgi:hypothetical protein
MTHHDHDRPESEWEHPHACEEGDTLVLFEDKAWEERWQITGLDDELVHVRRLDDHRGSAGETDSWPHDALAESLADGDTKRASDGLSQELATSEAGSDNDSA